MAVMSIDANTRRNLIAGVVGNILEWYDFAVFGFFSTTIAKVFFPDISSISSLMATFTLFASAYFMRPVGGIIFGYIGDTKGRKAALQLSVLLMAFSTTGMGLLPSYAQIGVMAPILLGVFRLLQGISVGGELIGSILFITELAPTHRRGLIGSMATISISVGMLLGSLSATLCHAYMSQETLMAWGWRLPFMVGLLLGVFGLWMRNGMSESEHFKNLKESKGLGNSPVVEVVNQMPFTIFKVILFYLVQAGGFYMLFIWLPTFLTHMNTPILKEAYFINSICLAIMIIVGPIVAAISDDIGRGPILVLACIGMLILTVPLFGLIIKGSFYAVFFAQFVFSGLLCMLGSPGTAAVAEMFPTRYRYSGIGLGHNIAFAVFGGTTPLICTWLVYNTTNPLMPAYYLTILAAISLVGVVIRNPQYEGDRFFDKQKRRRKVRLYPYYQFMTTKQQDEITPRENS